MIIVDSDAIGPVSLTNDLVHKKVHNEATDLLSHEMDFGVHIFLKFFDKAYQRLNNLCALSIN